MMCILRFHVKVYMGIVDVTCLFICADLAGIWQITGQVFCHSPIFAYIAGNISMGRFLSIIMDLIRPHSRSMGGYLLLLCISSLQPNIRSVLAYKNLYF
ncbi:hypothetical protein ANCCAN_19681 [Ancylostoma caninum]|uniref:Uncharacterized protein n=1 Tax=Ancylostoma caninum TaxID=29170 RepID=A0A368FTY9_ANCCA|nr:hypothetical protein ANCCAN_19681 [Ancylostoma caninum]